MYRILLVALLGFWGCAKRVPNTWDARIQNGQESTQVTLYYRLVGKGKPVVLLHGFGTSSATFLPIIPYLKDNFSLYLIDLKGFGNSPKPDDGHYSVYDQALLVDRFLKEHHLNDIILIGHSYGGGVALALALLDPERIKKMVLIDSAAYRQRLPKLLRWMQMPLIGPLAFYLLPASFEVKESYRYAFFDDQKIPKKSVESCTKSLNTPFAKRVYLQASKELVPDDIDTISRRYAKITIPTLLIWGERDIVIPKSKAYRLLHDLPDASLHIIPRCGHIPHEECPKEVVKVLRPFMVK